MKTILHLFDHSIPLHSGYTFRSLAILREQHKLGYRTLHLTTPKHHAKPKDKLEETVDGYHFYRTQAGSNLLAKLPILNQWDVVLATKKRLNAILSQHKVDILHAHSPCLNGMAALQAGKKFNIPVVYEMRAAWEDAAVDHGTCKQGDLRYRLSRALESYVLKRADAITTICQGLKQDMMIRGIEDEKITIIPNAVDSENFTLDNNIDKSLQTELGLSGYTVLGFIGSFYAYEGLALLIKALPTILTQQPNTKLLLVGGGFEEQNLQQQVKQLNLEKQVVFTGRVPHQQVQRYYNLVDLLVYPRLSMRLTDLVTPLKPLEAMAQGRLVLASDVGGHQELIKEGQNGKLFKAGDAQDLANKAIDFLKHSEQWPDYRKNGRRFIETERNWSKSVSYYQDIYKSLLEK